MTSDHILNRELQLFSQKKMHMPLCVFENCSSNIKYNKEG